jgi:hypothetical protein
MDARKTRFRLEIMQDYARRVNPPKSVFASCFVAIKRVWPDQNFDVYFDVYQVLVCRSVLPL